MRLPLLLTVLISVAAPAYAEGARESRYGPTTQRQATAAAAAAARYDGPLLSWSNKRPAPSVTTPPTASAPTRAAPPVNWTGAPATLAPAAYAPPPAQAALPPPTSLYAAPRAASAAGAPATRVPAPAPTTSPPSVKDWSSYRSSRMTGVAPAAATIVPPPPPAQALQVAAANTGGTRARYYSVDREYGLTPDPAPPPGPDSRVLITTSEPPPEPKDATPIHGSADWLAAGVTGDDDQDDSASRRAKTRNETL
jgi:hypothetical protein